MYNIDKLVAVPGGYLLQPGTVHHLEMKTKEDAERIYHICLQLEKVTTHPLQRTLLIQELRSLAVTSKIRATVRNTI